MFIPKTANVKNGDNWLKIPFSEVKKYDEIQILDSEGKKFINQAGKSIFVVATEPFINDNGFWNVGIY